MTSFTAHHLDSPPIGGLLKFTIYFHFILNVGWAAETHLCGRFYFDQKAVTFNKNERILICGEKGNEAWQGASEAQALFHLKTILQYQGYFNVITKKVGAKTLIQLGKRTEVTKWKLEGAPAEIDPDTYRRVKGEYLTPELLDNISDRVKKDIERWGNGCPSVESEAFAKTGEVTTRAKTGPWQVLVSVESEVVEGLNPDIFRRYQAFIVGERFNHDLLSLTENRIKAENLLQNTHFNVSCDAQGVKAVQKNVAGPPRLFIIGIGANTETGPQGKVSWKHTRLGALGSNLEFSLLASLKKQEFNTFSDWYFSESLNRFHFRPSLKVKHENENAFERYVGELRVSPATSWDNQVIGIQATFGPSLQFIKTVRGEGSDNSKFLAFHADAILNSHLYELLKTSPQEGFEIQANSLSTIEGVLSNVTAYQIQLRVTQLWNFFHYNPAFLVIGLRGAAAVTLTDERPGSKRLPSNFFQFLGGSTDLRGFARLELPKKDGSETSDGALTSAFISTEIRFPDLLPWKLQPLVFVDIGMLGKVPLSLDPVVYWSPGGGLRWDSPIGVFRATLAQGRVVEQGGTRTQWQPFLSYGEEF